MSISSNSLKNGVYIYQNYIGNRDISELENVYFAEEDLVFEEEKRRSTNSLFNRNEDGEFSKEEEKLLGRKFAIRFYGVLSSTEQGFKGPKFFSREKEYADSELPNTLVISSYIWYDDYNFVYSVDNDGIYVYNCILRNNVKLQEILENIKINSVESGKIIYNENLEILLDEK